MYRKSRRWYKEGSHSRVQFPRQVPLTWQSYNIKTRTLTLVLPAGVVLCQHMCGFVEPPLQSRNKGSITKIFLCGHTHPLLTDCQPCLFPVSVILSFWECDIDEILSHVGFGDWLPPPDSIVPWDRLRLPYVAVVCSFMLLSSVIWVFP